MGEFRVVTRGVGALLVLVALAAAALAEPGTRSSAAKPVRALKDPAPMLGILYREGAFRAPRGTLAWFDPLSLQALPGRKAPLGGYVGSWTFSSDRAVLAIVRCWNESGEATGVRFVNARSMRVLGAVRLPQYDCVDSLTWLRPSRLLALVRSSDEAKVAVVDPLAHKLLGRTPLPSMPWAIGRTHDELVLLFVSSGSFAPARIGVVDPAGHLRVAAVDRVLAGTVVDDESADHRARTLDPGLAVDPDGRRAFLVPASGPVAEIDLQTLAVSYHEVDRPSLARRVLNWLVPPAGAKSLEGPTREAAWVGDGRIIVSGTDYSIVTDDRGDPRTVGTPAGTNLIDTRSWTSRILSQDTSGFAVSPGLVIAEGGRWNEAEQRSYGPGLLGFTTDGRELWRLHPGEARWIDPAGSVGYVHLAEGHAEVVDLTTGRVVGMLERNEQIPWPLLLAAQSSRW